VAGNPYESPKVLTETRRKEPQGRHSTAPAVGIAICQVILGAVLGFTLWAATAPAEAWDVNDYYSALGGRSRLGFLACQTAWLLLGSGGSVLRPSTSPSSARAHGWRADHASIYRRIAVWCGAGFHRRSNWRWNWIGCAQDRPHNCALASACGANPLTVWVGHLESWDCAVSQIAGAASSVG
jgi:hypothetical protein